MGAKKIAWKIFKACIYGMSVLGIIAGLIAWRVYDEAVHDLPTIDPLAHYNPKQTSFVYSRESIVIGEFYTENRIVVPLRQIPTRVRDAFIAAEDQNFYSHHGIDWLAILRATAANIRARHVVQGGSTITQQVVKALLVGDERNYRQGFRGIRRKIREAVLAWRVEHRFSKNDILEIYLNNVYLGSSAYGVEAASHVYFGKSAMDLTVAEAALLGGLAKAPSKDSPHVNIGRALAREHYVLGRLASLGKISWADYAKLSPKLPLLAARHDINHEIAPYFVEYVREYLVEEYGDTTVLEGGLKAQTTLSLPSQKAAEKALRDGLQGLRIRFKDIGPMGEADPKEVSKCLDHKPRIRITSEQFRDPGLTKTIAIDLDPRGIVLCAHGYRAVLNQTDSEKLLLWRGENNRALKKYDEVLVVIERDYDSTMPTLTATLPNASPIEGAILSLDVATGAIRAMVGGNDFKDSEFNRAIQARRQIGSAIKPLLYTAAMDNGFNEVSILPDAPIDVPVIGGVWSPKNYQRKFLGPITLRTAFAKSINTVSVRLALAVGLSNVIAYFKLLGITSPIPNHISVSLGTSDVTLPEIIGAYAVFPRGGKKLTPYFMTHIQDHPQKSVGISESHTEEPEKPLISPATAYIMVDMMKAVTQFGTGRKAKDFPRPIAGKTGTSTDYRDAWFIGYSHDVITGVWIGRDNFMPIGFDATGGRVALPIWIDFMTHGHPDTVARDFEKPDGLVFWPVDPWNGRALPPHDAGAVMLPFKPGSEPNGKNSLLVSPPVQVEDQD